MGLIVPSGRKGQAKPYASIPRIDWTHPLSKGLFIYCYDSGGIVTDLVSNKVGKRNGANFGVGGSKFGRGVQYPGAGLEVSTEFPNSNLAALTNAVHATGIFSYATAWYVTALPAAFASTFVFGDAVGSGFGIYQGINSPSEVQLFTNDAQGTGVTTTLNTTNAFHTALAVCPTSATQIGYFDGVNVGSGTQSNISGETDLEPIFGAFQTNATVGDGDGVLGQMYYGAVWNRPLTAREALQLHLDPYCFLIYPEDELFIVGVTAGGTAVTADSGVPFEFLGSLRSDGLALLEWIASVRADRPLQLEALAAVRRDNIALPEFVAGLSANTAAQLEFLGSTRRDNLGPLEMASALRSDVIVLMETLAGQRSDMIAATEILAGLRADLVMPIENLGTIGVTGSAAVQIETIGALKSDAAIPFEMASSFRADASAPLEFTAGSSAQSGVTLENTLGLQGNSAVQIETQGGVGVTGSAVVQLEITAKFQSDAGVLFESFLAVSFSLSGMTINSAGVFIPFVTVLLFRTSDNVFIASTTSDAGGNYSFTGLPNNTTDYFVNGYLTGAPDLFGTTSDKLTPS